MSSITSRALPSVERTEPAAAVQRPILEDRVEHARRQGTVASAILFVLTIASVVALLLADGG